MKENRDCYQAIAELLMGGIDGGAYDKARLVQLVERLDGEIGGFLDWMKRECGQDSARYVSCLCCLSEATEDAGVKERLYETLFEMEDAGDKPDIFSLIQLDKQWTSNLFLTGGKRAVERDWKINGQLKTGMECLLHAEYKKIPYEERDSGLVVIVTTSLLENEHSATNLLLCFCKILWEKLQKKILIISEVSLTDTAVLAGYGVRGNVFCFRHLDFLDGNFWYPWEGSSYQGYQIKVAADTVWEMQMLVDNIYRMRPLCVWSMGAFPYLGCVMQQFTTWIHTPFVQGFPGIPADVFANYFPRISQDDKGEGYLRENGVKIADMIFTSFSIEKSRGIYKRADFGIPEEAFCIAVVGTRLEQECTEPFLSCLAQVLKEHAGCVIVFIGKLGEKFEGYLKQRLKFADRCLCLGYQTKLQEVLGLTDLYVNQPAQGGSGQAMFAMREGKPVVTLPKGDIAVSVGEDFWCRDFDEYVSVIRRYITDEGFYKEQSEKCLREYRKWAVDDEEMARLMQGVLDLCG